MAKGESRRAYRDAGTGEFITKRQAENRPANTVIRENVPKPGHGTTDRKKK